jgi:plastocyanin
MPPPRLIPLLASALALGLAGCSSSPSSSPAATSPNRIVVAGQNGLPRFVTPGAAAGEEDQVAIIAGATVTWRFATTGYDVISGSYSPDAGCVPDGVFCSPNDQNCADAGAVPPQAAGSFYQRTFQTVGDYPYFSQHGCPQGMTGVVHVLEAPPPDAGVDGGVDGGADGGP